MRVLMRVNMNLEAGSSGDEGELGKHPEPNVCQNVERHHHGEKALQSPTLGPNDRLTQLPSDFVPHSFDILSGRGKGVYQNLGNVRLRAICRRLSETYLHAESKTAKTIVLQKILGEVRDFDVCDTDGTMTRHQCRFVKLVRGKNGTSSWYELNDVAAREKIGHAMREVIASNGMSNKELPASKAQRNQVQDGAFDFEELRKSSPIQAHNGVARRGAQVFPYSVSEAPRSPSNQTKPSSTQVVANETMHCSTPLYPNPNSEHALNERSHQRNNPSPAFAPVVQEDQFEVSPDFFQEKPLPLNPNTGESVEAALMHESRQHDVPPHAMPAWTKPIPQARTSDCTPPAGQFSQFQHDGPPAAPWQPPHNTWMEHPFEGTADSLDHGYRQPTLAAPPTLPQEDNELLQLQRNDSLQLQQQHDMNLLTPLPLTETDEPYPLGSDDLSSTIFSVAGSPKTKESKPPPSDGREW